MVGGFAATLTCRSNVSAWEAPSPSATSHVYVPSLSPVRGHSLRGCALRDFHHCTHLPIIVVCALDLAVIAVVDRLELALPRRLAGRMFGTPGVPQRRQRKRAVAIARPCRAVFTSRSSRRVAKQREQ